MISLRRSIRYFSFIVALFFVSALIGWFFFPHLSFLERYLKEIIEGAADLHGFELFLFIFFNNLQSSLTGLVFGIFFCVVPLGICVLNGVVLGYVARLVSTEHGLLSLWRILPHGVFELPAVFFALALGVEAGVQSVRFLSHWSTRPARARTELVGFWKRAGTAFLLVVVPLLFIAALLETVLISYLA